MRTNASIAAVGVSLKTRLLLLSSDKAESSEGAPGDGGSLAHQRVRVLHQVRMGRDEVAVAALGGDGSTKFFPFAGEYSGRAAVEPIGLRRAAGCDGRQHHLRHSLGESLGMRQCQSGNPRAATDQPAVDVEVTPQPLHIRDQNARW